MELLDRINAVRTGWNLPTLRHNSRLAEAARLHAHFLASGAANLVDSHTGQGGSSIRDRVTAQGYQPVICREVTGWNTWKSLDWQMDYWLNSAIHRPILLHPDLTEAGVGYAYVPGSQYIHYWVVDFGLPVYAADPEPDPDPIVEPPISDPSPPTPGDHVTYAPVVVGGGAGAYDLLAYLRGDGRTYRLGNARGSYEVLQTQIEGDRFFQVKAWDDLSVVNWEEFIVKGDYICRDVDTSPGGQRFYRQFGAPWIRRFMRPGESFTQDKRLQFYNHACEEIDPQFSGLVTDTIQFVAHHARRTFPANDWAPVAVDDVVQLRWMQGGEDYFYARGYGMVGWGRAHSDPNSPEWSAICEMRPAVGRLSRLHIGCL